MASRRLVSPAIAPIYPSRPNKKLSVSLVFAITMLLGVMASFLLEALDNTIKSAADVSEKLERPLLGMVPLLKTKKHDCSRYKF